jgi:SAM-dependent methyltransferase
MFSNRPEMFGGAPSVAAIKTVEIFKKEKLKNILELGGGQGRDSIFFAQSNFAVQVLDYSQSGVDNIVRLANTFDLVKRINVKIHDVRKPLPFKDESFDGCFSHMLYCMAFTTKELKSLTSELHRVLKPGSINIYTVRHTEDADYGIGIHRGEDLYETGGFIVHFFSTEKIKQLSSGFDILNIDSFEEGTLPRKLFRVTLRKK